MVSASTCPRWRRARFKKPRGPVALARSCGRPRSRRVGSMTSRRISRRSDRAFTRLRCPSLCLTESPRKRSAGRGVVMLTRLPPNGVAVAGYDMAIARASAVRSPDPCLDRRRRRDNPPRPQVTAKLDDDHGELFDSPRPGRRTGSALADGGRLAADRSFIWNRASARTLRAPPVQRDAR